MNKISKDYYEQPALFTEEELKKLNLTPEELANLEAADAFCDTAELLPDDEKGMDAFFDKIEKTFPNDFQGAFEKLGEVAQKDPAFFRQLLALNSILNDVEEVPPARVEKINPNLVKKAQADEKLKAILDALK